MIRIITEKRFNENVNIKDGFFKVSLGDFLIKNYRQNLSHSNYWLEIPEHNIFFMYLSLMNLLIIPNKYSGIDVKSLVENDRMSCDDWTCIQTCENFKDKRYVLNVFNRDLGLLEGKEVISFEDGIENRYGAANDQVYPITTGDWKLFNERTGDCIKFSALVTKEKGPYYGCRSRFFMKLAFEELLEIPIDREKAYNTESTILGLIYSNEINYKPLSIYD